MTCDPVRVPGVSSDPVVVRCSAHRKKGPPSSPVTCALRENRRCKTQKDECHEQVPLKWLKLLVAPLLALAVGFLSYACGRQGQVPILLMYFGAQTGSWWWTGRFNV